MITVIVLLWTVRYLRKRREQRAVPGQLIRLDLPRAKTAS
jgi:hypothetical protein